MYIGPESAEWIDSFKAFSNWKREFFGTVDEGLLAAFCYLDISA